MGKMKDLAIDVANHLEEVDKITNDWLKAYQQANNETNVLHAKYSSTKYDLIQAIANHIITKEDLKKALPWLKERHLENWDNLWEFCTSFEGEVDGGEEVVKFDFHIELCSVTNLKETQNPKISVELQYSINNNEFYSFVVWPYKPEEVAVHMRSLSENVEEARNKFITKLANV